MSALADLVKDYGLTLDVFAAQLSKEMADRVLTGARALPDHDREVLQSVGVSAADLDEQLPPEALTVSAADLLADSAAMLSTSEMAAALDRSESRVRGAIADGSLAGMKIGRFWRLPSWQIYDGRPLPHLRAVIAAIPPGVSLSTVSRVMTLPSDELFLDSSAMSPREWLLAGGDPATVSSLLVMLLAW